MNIFSFGEKKSKTAAPAVDPLEERLDKIERDMLALRADMDSWMDRVVRLTGRIVKRAAIDNPPEPPEPEDRNARISEMIRLKRQGITRN